MHDAPSGTAAPAPSRARGRTLRPPAIAPRLIPLAILTLSACVSYRPDPLVPAEILRELELRAAQDLTAVHPGPWRSEWFPLEADVVFDDGLDLAEASTLALCYAPTVRDARAAARIAGAQVLQAGVLENPQLSLGPRISLQDSQWIFPASVTWELPLWGVAAARRERAAALADQRVLQVVEAELEALSETRRAFLRLSRLQRQRATLDDLARSQADLLRWVGDLQAAGQLDAVSVYLARSEHDETRLALEDVLAEIRRTRSDLSALMGLLPDAPVELRLDADFAVPDLAATDRQALMDLPGLRAAEAAYRLAEASLRLEVRKQYPAIAFGPTFEDDRGEPTLGPQLDLDLPLFDRNRGNIATAEEARDRAREAYREALLAAIHREARARDDLLTASRRFEIHRTGAMQDAESAAASLQSRLRIGRVNVVEVLAAQRAIARARTRAHELEEELAAARLRAALTGGLALQPSIARNDSPQDQP